MSSHFHDAELQAARLALACLDLTSLRNHGNDSDSEASITALAERAAGAATAHGAPAALCVYPRFVPTARRALDALGLQQVRVATVVNFPQGDDTPAAVAQAIAATLADGADEIDAVLPWRALRAGDAAAATALVRACRAACGTTPLKIILETGELKDPALIRLASQIAIGEGADFLKTSTGKVPVNATPEAVAVMLAVIAENAAEHHAKGGKAVGLKVAGGVASVADVQKYVALVALTCGQAWLNPQRLRFGASSLLPVLLAALDGAAPLTAAAGY